MAKLTDYLQTAVVAKGVPVQAERYAKGVSDSPFNLDGYRVPLLYSTNGEVIYFHDVRHPLNTSRKLSHYHTPAALNEMFSPRPASALVSTQLGKSVSS